MFGYIGREYASCNLEDAVCCVRRLSVYLGCGKSKHLIVSSSLFVGAGEGMLLSTPVCLVMGEAYSLSSLY